MPTQDQPPLPRVQGYLTKDGETRFYQLTNEYMSYWQNKQAWQEGKAPLGSYNIMHFERVTQDNASVWLQFVNGNVRHLVARNAGACVCARACACVRRSGPAPQPLATAAQS